MNKKLARIIGLTAVALATAQAMAADLKIGFISSLSGPVAALGVPYEKGIRAAIAEHPEISGRKVQLIVLDDASDPTTAGRNARKLIEEEKVDVIMGTSGVPAAIAMAQVGRETKTPMIGLTPIGLPPADAEWLFTVAQPTPLMVNAVVEKMKANGVKTVAYIGFTDAWGDLVYDALLKATEPAGIKVVANERYARSDQSVLGQATKIIAANPDAVLVGAAGGGTVLPHTTLVERGYKGQIYQTHGAATPDFVRLGGKNVEGAVMAASLMLVMDQVPDSNASKKVALEYISAYEKAYPGTKASTFGANVYDAGLLLQKAVPIAAAKGKPGTPEFRSALRDALEQTKELVGTQGVYTMTAADHSGFDKRGRELMQLKDGKWTLIPE